MFKTIQKMRTRDERGFTLVELLIVIAIIAILAAIAIPQFASYRQRGVRASVQSDVANIGVMMQTYYQDNGTYPLASVTASAGTPGTAFGIGTQTGRMSNNNGLITTGTATTYTIQVYCSPVGSGGTGSTTFYQDNTGLTSWS